MYAPPNPRKNIEELIEKRDVRGLLDEAAKLHGHYCPGLASGVMAAFTGVTRLGPEGSDGMERVMAEVECNNCFVDGIQVVTGCTLGNNALVYRDLGKTAVTMYRRGRGKGLRVAVKDLSRGTGLEGEEQARARELFERAVKKREDLDERERRLFQDLWTKASVALLEMPEEEVLKIETVDISPAPFAPMHPSAICSGCKEKLMETRARLREGEPVCLDCAGERHWMVQGSGILLSR